MQIKLLRKSQSIHLASVLQAKFIQTIKLATRQFYTNCYFLSPKKELLESSDC